MADGEFDQARKIAYAQFAHDAAAIGVHALGRQRQRGGHLNGRIAVHDQFQHLALAHGQALQRAGGAAFAQILLDHAARKLGAQITAAGMDHAHTIVAAGRADLCAIARGFLADPHLVLRDANERHVAGHVWPPQYLAARSWRNVLVLQGPTDADQALGGLNFGYSANS